MKNKAIFYHAGCPVCVAAEQNVADGAAYHINFGADLSVLK
jgi:hypothetical protein